MTTPEGGGKIRRREREGGGGGERRYDGSRRKKTTSRCNDDDQRHELGVAAFGGTLPDRRRWCAACMTLVTRARRIVRLTCRQHQPPPPPASRQPHSNNESSGEEETSYSRKAVTHLVPALCARLLPVLLQHITTRSHSFVITNGAFVGTERRLVDGRGEQRKVTQHVDRCDVRWTVSLEPQRRQHHRHLRSTTRQRKQARGLQMKHVQHNTPASRPLPVRFPPASPSPSRPSHPAAAC